MPTKSNGEGWLFIDNRNAPPAPGIPKFLETAVYTCSHCQRQIMKNPLRERERAYCRKCDHYICDQCAVVDNCLPWAKIVDDELEAHARGTPLILLGT